MTRRPSPDPLHTVAGLTGATTLAAAALLHLVWASGSTWPAATPEALADLVVGKDPAAGPDARPVTGAMPGPLACGAVAGALGAASVATIVATLGAQRADDAVSARRIARTSAAALLARGVAGLVAGVLDLGDASATFRRWDRRVYSPLCLGLAAAIVVGTRPAPARGRGDRAVSA